MPKSHDDNDGLKLITTLKCDTKVDVRSATGKVRGDIYFIDQDRPDEWLLCLPAKELGKLWSIMFDER